MTTALAEAFSPQIQSQMPPHVQTMEDLALTSWRDLAAKSGMDWVIVARRHLGRKHIRRIERVSDSELDVTVREPPGVPEDLRGRLLAQCALALADVYQEDARSEWRGNDALRVHLAFASDYDRTRFRQFESLEPSPPSSVREASVQPPTPPVSPAELFEPVVGYEDVKDAFARAMDPARRPVHVLLLGPPASAKSLFLLQVSKLPGAYMVLGGTTSKAGLAEVLLEEQPAYLLIDELDKMDREDLSVLLSLCETGTVSVTKYQRRQRVDLPTTRVFAAANSDTRIPREVLSRFLRFRLRAYTWEEFIEVVTRMLPATEGASPDLASHIAARLSDRLESADVRDAVRLARMARSKDEVDRLLATMARYA